MFCDGGFSALERPRARSWLAKGSLGIKGPGALQTWGPNVPTWLRAPSERPSGHEVQSVGGKFGSIEGPLVWPPFVLGAWGTQGSGEMGKPKVTDGLRCRREAWEHDFYLSVVSMVTHSDSKYGHVLP